MDMGQYANDLLAVVAEAQKNEADIISENERENVKALVAAGEIEGFWSKRGSNPISLWKCREEYGE